MGILWILVAHRSGARFFIRGKNGDFRLIHEIEHPEGRLKDHEVGTDRPGRTFDAASPRRHGYSPPQSPTEQIALDFSKEVARYLDEARDLYDQLVLIAEPKLLGLLRRDLSASTSQRIVKTVAKNLGPLPDHEISNLLSREVQNAGLAEYR